MALNSNGFCAMSAIVPHNEERGRERQEGNGSRGGHRRSRDGSRKRAESDGADGSENVMKLRRRVQHLEKEKTDLMSSHNHEVFCLQVELVRLRSAVEQGEAERAELQYQLTASKIDAERSSRENHTLTERGAELQQRIQDLSKALDVSQRSRAEDQHALQQEIEERHKMLQSSTAEKRQLNRQLQEQEEALLESEKRVEKLKKEKEEENELNQQQAGKLKELMEQDERTRREKELSDQRLKSLESNMEVARAAHLESQIKSDIMQRRILELEAALALERSGQQEAQCNLDLLRSQFREVERAYNVERERSSNAEHSLQRLQAESNRRIIELKAALETEQKMTSDLTDQLEEEKKQHGSTFSLLEQTTQRHHEAEEVGMKLIQQIRETLQHHNGTGRTSTEDDGSCSPASALVNHLKATLSDYQHSLEQMDKQVQDLVLASQRLEEEKQALQNVTSEQSRQLEEGQLVLVKLKEEVTRLQQESSDWLMQSQKLKVQLEKEREEMERGREERTAEIQKMTEDYRMETQTRLSFLYCLCQRLIAGCVLLDQPQSIVGNFTWAELCDVINKHVDQLTSDLQQAKEQVVHLRSVCEKKSMHVCELQHSHKCALSRLEAEWSRRHALTVTHLQSLRSQCDSLRDNVSSLERRRSLLTSGLSRLQSLLSQSRGESASLLSGCALLAGVLVHANRFTCALAEQKALLHRQLAEARELEEEVRRLAAALGGEKDEEEEQKRVRRRRWRKSVCVVLAVRRWSKMAKNTSVLFRLERGEDVPTVCMCVCGESPETIKRGRSSSWTDEECREWACSQWLRSKTLSSVIASSMADLQRVLKHSGSSPLGVIAAARSGLSRLLDHLNQSGAGTSLPSIITPCRVDEDSLVARLQLGLSRANPSEPRRKALVSALQQHFLLFTQRLHCAEVERRSLRMELTILKRGGSGERGHGRNPKGLIEKVPSERYQAVCSELQQLLSREHQVQQLAQEQTEQIRSLQHLEKAKKTEQTQKQCTLNHIRKSLSEARQEVSRKHRSLRILGKHLSGVHKKKKQLEEELRRAEGELKHAARRQNYVLRYMTAAETSYDQVREHLSQSHACLSAQSLPDPTPPEPSGPECIMGAPEVAACQSLLSTFSGLCQMFISRINWKERNVSAHNNQTAVLCSKTQDTCFHNDRTCVR
ncbi:coiled-coil domain-containing protein 171 isoform X2 [Thalassophryne amazonica]|uniref:coiled-coil domain-containing protein 171 isoform X2 n=1 Tax=Thalassophryne amazonica TaxID=390379 RepID=UPI001471A28A|nr:coiled-coil domain-containing protein 171 isoform X2 [Thalassophryne amazonica]